MPVIREIAQRYLKNFDFRSLFTQQLGWNNYHARPLYITLDNQTYTLRGVVEKRGVVVYVCEPTSDGSIPLSPIRRKIEKEVTKTAYEHIIIYVDAQREHQVWQWMRREPGKPTASREIPFSKNRTGEALLQKLPGIAFDVSQEDQLTTSHVTASMRHAFDVERVTRRFYDRFKSEHATFLRFIQGIPVEGDREWYASLMLNRLMFVYFIQKKGFLDNDEHFLRNRLRTVQERRGNGNFLNFYRHFLLRLFHEGLGKQQHSAELESLLGKVPYLNGGLFDVHELERANQQIQIADEAFAKLFDFFDAYQWHLDERPLREDNEINPDVLGYIFEKYINQKQMGAYYTKEDITEYIGKNTIIPFLFDAAENKCVIAFEPGSTTWRLLQENPDSYIYAAVKKGIELPLPAEIAAGLDDVSQRTEWNRPAPEEYALPTEIWREVVARRKRYEEVRAKLASGEIHSINDLITYNLDIRQFAHDVIENSEGPELVRAFYNSIADVTVLDPTCGSGAFLFAALNILEPLYEACLECMQSMVSDRDRLDETMPQSRRSGQPGLPDFRAILKQVEQHPNRRYFILKSIIINNLYGVDIMEEATEICKLRLFLKLAAQVERDTTKPNFGLEPLPDIDFNIRAGNTLVGFATYEEVKKVISSKLDFGNALERIEQKAIGVERDFEIFRKTQTEFDINPTEMTDMKLHLRKQLKELNTELDSYLAGEYGIDQNNVPNKEVYAKKFEQWRLSHQPFHWFVEFYGIMKSGGFDVIIGNPPYVAYSKVRGVYQIHNYLTESCGNLFAFTMERSLHLLRQESYFGMIVPVSSVSSESYKPLISLFLPRQSWLSSYSNRPGKLFAGVEQRLTIFIVKNSIISHQFTAPYQHWYETERDRLFHGLYYTLASIWTHTGMPIKSGSLEAEAVFAQLTKQGGTLPTHDRADRFAAWFHDGPTYWVRALPFEPNIGMRSERSNHYHRMPAKSHDDALILAALLSSTTFYLFFKMVSNCRDLGQKEWTTFPFGKPTQNTLEALVNLGQFLEKRLQATAVKCTRQYPSGTIEYEEYYPAKSKPIIDEIDRVLAQHYGFTDEELDFIINYDIKYRMGRDGGEEEE